ncbi:hypothetical protein DdX_00816 [Ditylenchus destructor]|uniref:FHA domain-containing protein n=1 Tax=Ditylenchus destructor TaxID=166010 RepID=A0AAD4NFQ2_9BILA|nr:hypothetical protein DdX_00816 [Ditylenchus destructor]
MRNLFLQNKSIDDWLRLREVSLKLRDWYNVSCGELCIISFRENTMLRRYSPRGIESRTLRMPATLIGSSPACDIVVKSNGVDEKHALIEYHPVTRSYWLRQIGGKAYIHKNSTTTDDEEQREKTPIQPVSSLITTTVIPASIADFNEPHQSAVAYRAENLDKSRQSSNSRTKERPLERDDNLEKRRALAAAVARQELLHYGAMLELHPADTIRFGNGVDATEYVFEMPPIQHRSKNEFSAGSSAQKPLSSSTNSSTYSTAMITKRPKKKRYHTKSSSFDQTDKLEQDVTLPVVGSKVNPRLHSDRFARPPQQQPNRRLCHLRNDAMAAYKALPQLQQRDPLPNSAPIYNRSRSFSVSKPGTSPGQQEGGEGVQSDHDAVGEAGHNPLPPLFQNPFYGENAGLEGGGGNKQYAIGNQLLQRVIRLQSEVQRRDAEISQLRENALAPSLSGDRAKRHLTSYREALSLAQSENERLKALLDMNTEARHERLKAAETKVFLTDLIYNTFFTVCCEELESLNNRVSGASVRDYADVFTETVKALQEPFSFRLMEINSKCSAAFENIRLEQTERDQLYLQFDRFLKEKIYPISKAFDTFLPVLKDAASMARESVRACSVFSQWSREFGDQLQLQPSWELMAFKADDLQTRFREWSMQKHWLPPSLLPLLKILIYEYRNRLEDQRRKEAEHMDSIAKLDVKIAELEELLESKNAKLEVTEKQVQEILESTGSGELVNRLKRTNEDLCEKVYTLDKRIKELSHGYNAAADDCHAIDLSDEVIALAARVRSGFTSDEPISNSVEYNDVNQERSRSIGSDKWPDTPRPLEPPIIASIIVSQKVSEVVCEPEHELTHTTEDKNEENNRQKRDATTIEMNLPVDETTETHLKEPQENDEMSRLATGYSIGKPESIHSKDSIQAKEEFYKELKMEHQYLNFGNSFIAKSSEEECFDKTDEDRSSADSDGNTVEDSELPESRAITDIESARDPPNEDYEKIESEPDDSEGSPMNEADDPEHEEEQIDVKLSDEGDDSEKYSARALEHINRVYEELAMQKGQGQPYSSTPLEEINDASPENQMVSQISLSSTLDTVREVHQVTHSQQENHDSEILSERNPSMSSQYHSSESENGIHLSSASVKKEYDMEKDIKSQEKTSSSIHASEKIEETQNEFQEHQIEDSEDEINHNVVSKMPISEHHKNAIQFWQLASLLARMLSVDIPEYQSPDSLDGNTAASESKRNSPINGDGEIERRKSAVNSIIEKLELVLDRLRSSAGLNNGGGLIDSEDSGHCNSSSTTEGGKLELGYADENADMTKMTTI